MRFPGGFLLFLALLISLPGAVADSCGEMEVWDTSMGMCMPLASADAPMRMLMLHGNIFGTRIWEQGPRARDAWAAPDMLMADLGSTVGGRHYVNLELMLTTEKWTFPTQGYPLLLQIGERDAQGRPFIDAQHPHSSPIMGLTFSDTIRLGNAPEDTKDNLKVFFAPRGESTDGPVPAMHRVTGMVNPDMPLGHHIGQDVGHISSTVMGAALQLGRTTVELSGFHGSEPEPVRVDLPIGKPDSVALRVTEQWDPQWTTMISAARISGPEMDQPDVVFENRYSASTYFQKPLNSTWEFYDTLIYGAVTHYDESELLSSLTEELLFKGETPRIWSRIELLQRAPGELAIANANPRRAEWVAAVTMGYTHAIYSNDSAELGLGASATKDFLPSDFRAEYGGNPWSGKIFIQLSGMKMFDFFTHGVRESSRSPGFQRR